MDFLTKVTAKLPHAERYRANIEGAQAFRERERERHAFAGWIELLMRYLL